MGWPHPKICSYFLLFSNDDLPCPRHIIFRMPKDKRRSRGMPCVSKNPPLTALLKKVFSEGFAGPCEWFEVLHVSHLCGWSVWVVSTGRHHQSSVQFFGTQKGSNLLFGVFTPVPTPHLVRFVGELMESDLILGTSWQYSADSVQTATRCTNKQAWECHLWHTSGSMISKWRGKVLVQAKRVEGTYHIERKTFI